MMKLVHFCDTCAWLGEYGSCGNPESAHYTGYVDGQSACERYQRTQAEDERQPSGQGSTAGTVPPVHHRGAPSEPSPQYSPDGSGRPADGHAGGGIELAAGGALAKLGPVTEIGALPGEETAIVGPETARLMAAMAEQMARMAQAMEETRERMAELEAAVRTLEKVTPAQAAEVNRRIRERAAEICRDWRMDGCEKLVAGWIRKTVRERTGVNTAREIPRCDFGSVCGTIAAWEDVALIRGARKRMKEAGAS